MLVWSIGGHIGLQCIQSSSATAPVVQTTVNAPEVALDEAREELPYLRDQSCKLHDSFYSSFLYLCLTL